MSKKKTTVQKLFGTAPKKGYKFSSVEVKLTDNNTFKGFLIQWSAVGIGFGELWWGWGIDLEKLKEYPHQQGFHLSTESMSDEFVTALMKKALPKITKILLTCEKRS